MIISGPLLEVKVNTSRSALKWRLWTTLTHDCSRYPTSQDTQLWLRYQLFSSKTCSKMKCTCLTVFQRCTFGSDLLRTNLSTPAPIKRPSSTSKTFLTREWKTRLKLSTCMLVASHRCSKSSSKTGLIHTQSITGRLRLQKRNKKLKSQREQRMANLRAF
jgi:hypothetical protein